MRINVIYLLILTLVLLASCKSTKHHTADIAKQTEVDTVYNLMHNNQVDAQWLVGKFKGVYQMPEKQQVFYGQIRMKKDSVIWVSINAVMNIEIFRLIVQPDSFKFINKIDKTFISESNQSLVDYFGVDVDFSMLEALILGNDFPYYQTDNFKLRNTDKNYVLSTISRHKIKKYRDVNDSSKILVQSMYVNKSNYRITKQKVKILGKDKVVLRMFYDKFEDIDGFQIATNWILKYKEDDKSYVELNFSNYKLDTPTKFPFRISSKYKRKSIH
jgi:hypothetical protein